MQTLLDIYADCPALLPAKDSLASYEAEVTSKKCAELIEVAQNIIKRVQQFEDNWKRESPDLIEEVPLTTVAERRGALWTSNLQYRSLADADINMMCNAIRILLFRYLSNLPWSWSPQEEESTTDQCTSSAITICRSIDYELQEIRKGASNHLLYWPLKVAFEVLGTKHPDIGTWLNRLLTDMEAGWSGKMGHILQGMRRNV